MFKSLKICYFMQLLSFFNFFTQIQFLNLRKEEYCHFQKRLADLWHAGPTFICLFTRFTWVLTEVFQMSFLSVNFPFLWLIFNISNFFPFYLPLLNAYLYINYNLLIINSLLFIIYHTLSPIFYTYSLSCTIFINRPIFRRNIIFFYTFIILN